MNKPLTIDLNCDVGESYGAYRMGQDEALLPFVSSANIACGFHAGDPATMKKTVRLALELGVGIGAHPGLPDLVGFGRREMALSQEEAFDVTVYQLGALSGFVAAEGGRLHHVKPHGALYNMASVQTKVAEAIAEAVYKVNPELVLYGLAGGELIKAGEKAGLATAQEVFADRTYQANGTLTSRREPNALIMDADTAVAQVLRMVRDGIGWSVEGAEVAIQADTVCIHGDGPQAVSFAKQIREALEVEQIEVKAIASKV